MHVSSPLRMLRFEKGLTQQELADQIGVRQWVISALERGLRLNGPTFPKVAALLQRDPARLRRQMQQWRTEHPAPQSRLSVRQASERA